jgi:hypothetical protein
MVSRVTRLKMLKRIAQAATPAAPAAATPATPPPPPPFQASSVYPGIHKGFSSASVSLIDQLCSLLNMALHYASNGTANFQIFRNNNFNFDASASPSVDQKNLMIFSQMVYRTLLNSGNPFVQALTGQQIQDMVGKLVASTALNALSQTNPTGTIAQKVPGALKTNILTYLQYLASANPATQR